MTEDHRTQMDLGRNVICSYDCYEALKSHQWQSRLIFPDKYAPNKTFYYKGKKGNIRTVSLKECAIREYIYEYCESLDMEVPTIYTKIIRKFKQE